MRAFVLLSIIGLAVAPPPRREEHQQVNVQPPADAGHQTPPPAEHAATEQPKADDGQKPLYQFAYSRYLEEVVKVLESDPKFTERLKGMNEDDIKAGKIADHIDDLGDHVFDRLHKAKLDEIERLREQIAKQIEAEGGTHNVKIPDHIDVENWEKFGKEDLRKLITKTVDDMNEIDKERREEFKEYEMKKKAEEDHKLAMMNEQERVAAKHEAEETEKRHNQHEKLKHPGSRDQLEEVWEETDHMDKDSFEPRSFFALHDLNGDGHWNDDELEALFQIELEKMYNDTNPDDDPRERMEEMYRMREHVVKQMDKNNDRLISLEEFLQDTEAQTPDQDEGWKDLGQEQVYTDEELQKFEEEYAKQQAGWGDHAYDPVTAAPIQANVHQGVNNNQQQAQQVHAAEQVQEAPRAQPLPAAAQPAQAQPAQAQPAQAQPAQAQPVPVQPVQHEPIKEVKQDPSYGI